MHCGGCENNLREALTEIPQLEKVQLDWRRGALEFDHPEKFLDFSLVKKIVEERGYQLFEEKKELKEKKQFWRSWVGTLVVLGLVVSFFVVFQKGHFFEKTNFLGRQITFPLVFLTGVVASLSSCLAVVGSVVAVFSFRQKNEDKNFWKGNLEPNLLFHLGRLATFFLLGGLLGFAGGRLNIDGRFLSFYLILISLVLAWLGLNILGVLPSIAFLGIRMPKGVMNVWQKLKETDGHWSIILLGALTFFLPCGFTQSMQILALASGNFWLGGGILFFFALGTLPVLFLFGTTIRWAKNQGWKFFQRAVGLLILFSAFFTLSSGQALLQSKKTEDPLLSSNSLEKENESVQIVRMKITASGFEPNVLKIKAGIPIKWIIQGDAATGCTNKIIIPGLGIEKNILPGENEIIFNINEKKGAEIPFSCWMGMVRGKFVVE